MSKIRLVGGPAGGKVVDDPGYREIVFRGPKKMTRKQRYEYEDNIYNNPRLMYMPSKYRYPQVEARYRMAFHPSLPSLPAMHPDGSIFYEYVEGSKRDLPTGY